MQCLLLIKNINIITVPKMINRFNTNTFINKIYQINKILCNMVIYSINKPYAY